MAKPEPTTYRLLSDLRVPNPGDGGKFKWLPAGSEAKEEDLKGLVLPALEQGGFVEKVSEGTYQCEECQNHGNQKEKAATYTRQELVQHYQEKHPTLVPPEEVNV